MLGVVATFTIMTARGATVGAAATGLAAAAAPAPVADAAGAGAGPLVAGPPPAHAASSMPSATRLLPRPYRAPIVPPPDGLLASARRPRCAFTPNKFAGRGESTARAEQGSIDGRRRAGHPTGYRPGGGEAASRGFPRGMASGQARGAVAGARSSQALSSAQGRAFSTLRRSTQPRRACMTP